MPKMIGDQGHPHTWRLHSYRGLGRIPGGLKASDNAYHRLLLKELPRLLQGYGKTPGIDGVVVVLDSDKKNCREFLDELQILRDGCRPVPRVLFRLAIEEIEAWYLGDRKALLEAYPRGKRAVLDGYVQDRPCDTWELLADAVYPGGREAILRAGWPLPGQVKHEWAEKIGPLLGLERNMSPSFQKLLSGMKRLLNEA
ncbi:MAG: DUF4276 family protein [Nitrospirae bacterium]|nr:DUF4276 family protein [Nitrospirota bacterium]